MPKSGFGFRVVMMKVLRRRFVGLSVLAPILLLVGGILITLSLRDLPKEITLGLVSGVRVVGARADLWGIFLTACAMAGVNLVLADVLLWRERVLSFALLVFNLIFSALTLVAVGFILSLN